MIIEIDDIIRVLRFYFYDFDLNIHKNMNWKTENQQENEWPVCFRFRIIQLYVRTQMVMQGLSSGQYDKDGLAYQTEKKSWAVFLILFLFAEPFWFKCTKTLG